jgi:hypothetical protein
MTALSCTTCASKWWPLKTAPSNATPSWAIGLRSLAALLPLLPAKQRPTHPHDWMSTDAEVACPDPHCPTRFRITRLGLRRFSHAQTTAVPLPGSVGVASADRSAK